jgi:hypothetical protein
MSKILGVVRLGSIKKELSQINLDATDMIEKLM